MSDSTLTHSLRALALASTSLGLVLGYTPAQAQQRAPAGQNATNTPAAQAAQQPSNRGYVVGDGGVARATTHQDGAEGSSPTAAQAAQQPSNRGYVVGDAGVARRKAAGTYHHFKIEIEGRQAAPAAQPSPQASQTQQTMQPKGSYRYLKRQSSQTEKPGATASNDGTP
ncbi:hypothetical protein [Thermomonas alba]|uniref:hypothetical protein n=1 Tax=Thermomonas alba TaxID=2888525 RepID=UPI001F03E5F8|nr:hypothetical protein [Thermomonas alba]